MSILFERKNDKLVLRYEPNFGVEDILMKLRAGKSVKIKNTFEVALENLFERKDENFSEDVVYFCIGNYGKEYVEIDSKVIGTQYKFFFSNDINFSEKMFIANRRISILGKIDKVIGRDFYVGGSWEKRNGISVNSYMELIKTFPNSTELTKYTQKRISVILKEFFPECDRFEEVYNKYIKKKQMDKSFHESTRTKDFNTKIELAQFSIAVDELENMLIHFEAIEEKQWQEKIYRILKLLYPKYIFCESEVQFTGCGDNDKRPDFLLVDTNGFVDILEIKKASMRILTKYRNNYVASCETSGAIQQIEKYIFCLNTVEEAKKDVIKRIEHKLPVGMKLQIINPQGILLFGRSKDFSVEQRLDFEVLKRQYKHIADIMTYDDLLERLKNIQTSLSQQIKEK